MGAKSTVRLADAIAALRRELMAASEEGNGKTMRFAIEPIELTVQVSVTKDVDGKIGWELLGVGGSYERVTTQSLTMKLTPHWQAADGSTTTNFKVSSPAAQGDRIGSDQE